MRLSPEQERYLVTYQAKDRVVGTRTFGGASGRAIVMVVNLRILIIKTTNLVRDFRPYSRHHWLDF